MKDEERQKILTWQAGSKKKEKGWDGESVALKSSAETVTLQHEDEGSRAPSLRSQQTVTSVWWCSRPGFIFYWAKWQRVQLEGSYNYRSFQRAEVIGPLINGLVGRKKFTVSYSENPLIILGTFKENSHVSLPWRFAVSLFTAVSCQNWRIVLVFYIVDRTKQAIWRCRLWFWWTVKGSFHNILTFQRQFIS